MRDPQPGDRIADRYLLVDRLQHGAMGSVWRARCLARDVEVAIKLVRGRAVQPDAAERLRMEAQEAARVRHPSTVRVLDFGTLTSGEPFLVMELISGPSLAELRKERGPLPALEAVKLLLPVASALAAAHARGVVHRDIKPANIVLDAMDAEGRCQPKLLDLGLSKVVRADAQRPMVNASLTLESVSYMAPEQLRGDSDVDASADVWALAVVLYELTTGRLPFEGAMPIQYLWSVLQRHPVPPLQGAPGEASLWPILARGLARAKADRWPNMVVFGAALARWAMAAGATSEVTGAPLGQWCSEDPSTAVRSPKMEPPVRALWDLTGSLRFF